MNKIIEKILLTFIALLVFLGGYIWNKAENAAVLAGEVDARQEKLEALVEQQNTFNDRLLRIIESKEKIRTNTPTQENK